MQPEPRLRLLAAGGRPQGPGPALDYLSRESRGTARRGGTLQLSLSATFDLILSDLNLFNFAFVLFQIMEVV